MDPDVLRKAKLRALHLLEYMDRTEKGLRQKLEQDGYPTEVVDEAIRYVKSYGYIDDRRYADNYLRTRSSGKGRRRLFQELYQKGVPSALVQEAWEELCVEGEPDERASIREMVEKKVGEQTVFSRREYQRLTNYLARRGFSWGDILAVYQDMGIEMDTE